VANTATEAGAQPDPGRVQSPLLFKVLVCIGSTSGGANFGSNHGQWGIVFGSVGGLLAAVFWLGWIARVYKQHFIFRIIEGSGTGIVAGMIYAVWIHTMAWLLGFRMLLPEQPDTLLNHALVMDCIAGGVLGGLYGLMCMGFWEVHRFVAQRKGTS